MKALKKTMFIFFTLFIFSCKSLNSNDLQMKVLNSEVRVNTILMVKITNKSNKNYYLPYFNKCENLFPYFSPWFYINNKNLLINANTSDGTYTSEEMNKMFISKIKIIKIPSNKEVIVDIEFNKKHQFDNFDKEYYDLVSSNKNSLEVELKYDENYLFFHKYKVDSIEAEGYQPYKGKIKSNKVPLKIE
jgi:hypothetical protein